MTHLETLTMKNLVAIVTWLIWLPCIAAAQSNVPIDSPRGNYEGAENIHWYQQQSLRLDDFTGLPPVAGEPFICNENDVSVDCFGDLQRMSQESYYALGKVPIVVTVFVDTRQTPGFDFPYRRAIDAIRRTNDAFSRSGVNARLVVSEVRDFNFDARGYSAVPSEIFRQVYTQERDFIDNVAREDRADVLMFVRNTENMDRRNFCGAASVGINPPFEYLPPLVVLTAEEGNPRFQRECTELTAPHEFGHVLGLGHENNDLDPHLTFGRPFINQSTGKSTIMASISGNSIPYFSSPGLQFEGDIYGNNDTANAVRALNQAATNVALFWEIRFGRLRPQSSPSDPVPLTESGAATDTATRGFNVPQMVHEVPQGEVEQAAPRSIRLPSE